jgi:prepilin-type N-terminal cleavage/methylation domain-containing protein
MRTRGFTLVEILIVLGLSLLVLLAAFEFFGLTRSFFYKLKGAQEDSLAIQAALDKLRIDLLRAGCGLELAIRAGAIEGITAAGSLVILSQEDAYSLSADCAAGDTRLSLEKTTGLSAGRVVCLADEEKAERHTVVGVEADAIILAEPLEDLYKGPEAGLLLLEEVTYFLDEGAAVLRRKVNASPAQPLLDNAGLFEFAYLEEDNLVRVKLADKENVERAYELLVFPKNLGLILP